MFVSVVLVSCVDMLICKVLVVILSSVNCFLVLDWLSIVVNVVGVLVCDKCIRWLMICVIDSGVGLVGKLGLGYSGVMVFVVLLI